MVQEKVKLLNIWWNTIYTKKISTLSIVLGSLLMMTLYLVALDKQTQEVTTKEFINLLDSNCFKEVVFVEEEYFSSKNVKAKRI